jgi:hypothetical protein
VLWAAFLGDGVVLIDFEGLSLGQLNLQCTKLKTRPHLMLRAALLRGSVILIDFEGLSWVSPMLDNVD